MKVQPAERVAEEITKLNAQLAQTVRDPGAIFTLEERDQQFQALRQQLEDDGVCGRGESDPQSSQRKCG
ncbi:MAG: hypothetical protein M1140_00290 [Chloroflexi bacterium]|nr:hypothetical protein [Chloroflexota bacterium]